MSHEERITQGHFACKIDANIAASSMWLICALSYQMIYDAVLKMQVLTRALQPSLKGAQIVTENSLKCSQSLI